MTTLDELLRNNRHWADQVRREDPHFFERLSRQQAPKYLWIGCSDSRVPANQIMGLSPGEVFVHRNLANVMVHTDLNCLSAIQYAVDVLQVEHILLVGHYGCGGVRAARNRIRIGLADNWIRHVADVAEKHGAMLEALQPELRDDRLCELNAIEQAVNVCQTTVVQDAWMRGQALSVHGWVYSLVDGRVRELEMDVAAAAELQPAYQRALSRLAGNGVNA